MKLRKVTIKIESLHDGLKDFAETYQKLARGEKVEKEEIVSFVDIDVMRQMLTNQRIRLLKLINKHSPKTIYELAKMADRPYVNVFRDVKSLAEMGLVSLAREKRKVQPTAKYDELNICIPLKC